MKGKFYKAIWFHLLLMVIIAFAIYKIFFSSLDSITNHGVEFKVPDVVGMNVNDALKTLDNGGYQVDLDSSYSMKHEPGEVLSQMPDTGAMVKKGRTVFLIVNKSDAPLTPMPDLTGLSYRSGLMVIKSNKLRLGDTIHRPDIADGAILEQRYKNKQIAEGTMLPQGSTIDLVIGDGLSTVELDVPNVVGKRYIEGIALLNAMGLQFTAIWDAPIVDSEAAIIYYQSPKAFNDIGGHNQINEGGLMDIRMRQTREDAKGVNVDDF